MAEVGSDEWMAEQDAATGEIFERALHELDRQLGHIVSQADRALIDRVPQAFGIATEEIPLSGIQDRESDGLRLLETVRVLTNAEAREAVLGAAARIDTYHQYGDEPAAVRIQHVEKEHRDGLRLTTNEDGDPFMRKQRHVEVMGDDKPLPPLYDISAHHLLVRKATAADEILFGIKRGTTVCEARTEFWGKFGNKPHSLDQAVAPVRRIESGAIDVKITHAYSPVLRAWWRTGFLPAEHQWLDQMMEPGTYVARDPVVATRVLHAARVALEQARATDTSAPEFEAELKELLFYALANGSDEYGNRHIDMWLRSSEAYEPAAKGQPPIRSDIQGMRTYGYIRWGRNIGFAGTQLADELFVSMRADGLSCDMPLRSITEVVDGQRYGTRGHLHEGPTPRAEWAKGSQYGPMSGWVRNGREVPLTEYRTHTGERLKLFS